MFRSILKYTPLLKRSFICVMALLLLFGCFVRPLHVDAISYNIVSSALWSAFVGSGMYADGMEASGHLLEAVTLELVEGILGETNEEREARLALLKVITTLQGNSIWKLTDSDRNALSWLIWNSSAFNLLKDAAKYKSESDLPLVQAGTQLYVPTEDAMQNFTSITQTQILYTGFGEPVSDQAEHTNYILSGISDYLTTAMNSMLSWQKKINDTLTERLQSIREMQTTINRNFTERLASIREMQTTINQTLTDRLTTLHESVRTLKDHMDTRLLDIREMQSTINQTLTDRLTTLHESVRTLKDHMDTRLLDIREMQSTINQTLADRLHDMRQELYIINTTLTDEFSSLHTSVKLFREQTIAELSDLLDIQTEFVDELISLHNFMKSFQVDLNSRLSDIRSMLTTINQTLVDRLKSIRDMQTTINQNLTDRLKSIRDMQTTINQNLSSEFESLHSSLRVLREQTVLKLSDLIDLQKSYFHAFSISLDSLEETLSTRFSNLESVLLTGFPTLANKLDQILEKLPVYSDQTNSLLTIQELQQLINQTLNDRFAALEETFTSDLKSLEDSFISGLKSIEDTFITGLKSLEDTFTAGLKSLEDTLITGFPALQDKLDQILEKIPVYDDQIQIVQKPQIEVMVGEQMILVEDYASMSKAFSAKLAWVPQIFDFLAELRSRLNSGTPPKIALNLSAAEGSIDWGDDAYILDMSWYARYKPSVDTILSGIMWLCCGWAIYKRIPDILSGVGLTVENATQDPGHVWTSRAERADRKSHYKGG